MDEFCQFLTELSAHHAIVAGHYCSMFLFGLQSRQLFFLSPEESFISIQNVGNLCFIFVLFFCGGWGWGLGRR